jgi:hypothetical protein
MSDTTAPKKSEMLEVRIPHGTKTAFMQRAQAEGRAASAIVREQIDAYLDAPVPAPPRPSHWRRWPVLVAGVGFALAATLAAVAISPASARADLGPAFASLDADGNGQLSLAEFIDPARAHEISLVGTGVPPGPIGLGDQSAGGAYVRYILSSAVDDEDIPLVVAVDPPTGGGRANEVAALMETAFHRLDRNTDGNLDASEFGVR